MSNHPKFHIILTVFLLVLALIHQSKADKTIKRTINYKEKEYFTLDQLEQTDIYVILDLDSFTTEEDYYYFKVDYMDYLLIKGAYFFSDSSTDYSLEELREYDAYLDNIYSSGEHYEEFKIKVSERANRKYLILFFKFTEDYFMSEVYVESKEDNSNYVWIIIIGVIAFAAVVAVVIYCVFCRKRNRVIQQVQYDAAYNQQYYPNNAVNAYGQYGQNPYPQDYNNGYPAGSMYPIGSNQPIVPESVNVS